MKKFLITLLFLSSLFSYPYKPKPIGSIDEEGAGLPPPFEYFLFENFFYFA
jgi:hypothetical protein